MSQAFTAACIQFTAGPDPEPNLEVVSGLIRQARDAGAASVAVLTLARALRAGG